MKRHLTKRRRESILHACEVLSMKQVEEALDVSKSFYGLGVAIGRFPDPEIKLPSLKLALPDKEKGKP